MENSLTTILSTLIGAGIALFASYLVEYRRSENEKHKFSLEKIITVGEKFYELSGLSLLIFETRLDAFEKINLFNSPNARQLYIDTENSLQEQAKNIQKNTNTITSADIYFKINGVEYARLWMIRYQQALAGLMEIAEENDVKQLEETINELKDLLREIINIIKEDRKTISEKIQKLVLINKQP